MEKFPEPNPGTGNYRVCWGARTTGESVETLQLFNLLHISYCTTENEGAVSDEG